MLVEYQENRRHVLERNRTLPATCIRAKAKTLTRRPACSPIAASRYRSSTASLTRSRRRGFRRRQSFCRATTTFLTYRFDTLLEFDFDFKNSESRADVRERGVQMPRTLEISNWYLGFNWLDPVVGKGDTPDQQVRNRKLRQALSIAIDWEEFVRVFESKAAGEPAMGPVPPGLRLSQGCESTRRL